ncbi:hypothetical protein Q8A67_022141 [Cirrhinus molitorella]|uniref:Uncharacterized protein n=1 Tax=Cirrhinus molitorella TaxID=172907 RepID=A0AA88P7C9_9TELE|nr:hypothetical protein Q8A67_022141 [Cirrhinus molitorella]
MFSVRRVGFSRPIRARLPHDIISQGAAGSFFMGRCCGRHGDGADAEDIEDHTCVISEEDTLAPTGE